MAAHIFWIWAHYNIRSPPSSHISYLSPLIGREEEAWIEYIRKLPTTRFQPCLIEIHQIMCIFFPPPKTPKILEFYHWHRQTGMVSPFACRHLSWLCLHNLSVENVWNSTWTTLELCHFCIWSRFYNLVWSLTQTCFPIFLKTKLFFGPLLDLWKGSTSNIESSP